MLTLQRRPDGVTVLEAGDPGTVQHLTPRLIDQGLADGWLTVSGTRVVITGAGGALIYRLDREPGSFCCHCEAALADSVIAREHVAGVHPGVPSPDPQNPAGYRTDNFFATTRLE